MDYQEVEDFWNDIAVDSPEIGTKYDANKLRWDLLPIKEVEDVVQVLTDGAKEHGECNWQLVKPKTRYLAALYRHLVAWQKGEKTDPESDSPHLAHLVANALFLAWFDNQEVNDAQTNPNLKS
jgi:hypothetical protein